MNKATLIAAALPGFRGTVNLYKLDVPLRSNWTDASYEYVAVSAADVPYSGPETYIFGADENGEIADWADLHGSFRGALDHAQALRNAGYEIVTERV